MADGAIVEWWSRMQSANAEQRAVMAESLGRASGAAPARSGASRSRGGRRRGRGGRSRRSGD